MGERRDGVIGDVYRRSADLTDALEDALASGELNELDRGMAVATLHALENMVTVLHRGDDGPDGSYRVLDGSDDASEQHVAIAKLRKGLDEYQDAPKVDRLEAERTLDRLDRLFDESVALRHRMGELSGQTYTGDDRKARARVLAIGVLVMDLQRMFRRFKEQAELIVTVFDDWSSLDLLCSQMETAVSVERYMLALMEARLALCEGAED